MAMKDDQHGIRQTAKGRKPNSELGSLFASKNDVINYARHRMKWERQRGTGKAVDRRKYFIKKKVNKFLPTIQRLNGSSSLT